MELITLVILIIVCGLGMLLAFRIITYIMRLISIAILLIAIILVAGSYFSAQAYILPTAHSSFITLTNDGSFVVALSGTVNTQTYLLDTVATAAFARQFLKPLSTVDSASYSQLKTFAQTDIFANSDTVWLINAINKSGCTQEKMLTSMKQFQSACIDAIAQTQTKAQSTSTTTTAAATIAKPLNFFERIASLVDASALNRIPLKASFMQWFKNYYFS